MNYKIKITEENQAIVKRIANENEMNEVNFHFELIAFVWKYYYIQNGHFTLPPSDLSTCTELTTDQFVEMFDNKGTLVGRWFQALVDNALSSKIVKDEFYLIYEESKEMIFFKVLTNESGNPNLTFGLPKYNLTNFVKLMPKNFQPMQETELDNNQWNKPTEFNPKRGDGVLVWDKDELSAQEKVFVCEIKGAKMPIVVVYNQDVQNFVYGKEFLTHCYKHMKPIPVEEKVVEQLKQKSTIDPLKIVGYKAPFGVTEWGTKKDDIWVKDEKLDCYRHKNKQVNLPKQWVETWEAVYEETNDIEEDPFKQKVIDFIDKNIANKWKGYNLAFNNCKFDDARLNYLEITVYKQMLAKIKKLN